MVDHPKIKLGIHICLAFLVLIAALPASDVGQALSGHPKTGWYQSDLPYVTYLPLATRNYPPPKTVFGVEVNTLNTVKFNNAKNAKVDWVRNFAVSWAIIEPVRTATPTYNWSAVNEAGLIEAAAQGLTMVVTVRNTPSWAQKYPGVSCGPVASNRIGEFAQFMGNLVARYSAPPYNVKYWEIGNEVDVDPSLVTPDSIIGCWGDESDRYYGGGYFAEVLSQVYPAMKAADSQATVLIGGLLLSCDPTNPPPGKTCDSARFLEGILRQQGAAYFDAVSFHAYAYYTPGQNPEMFSIWLARGGVLLGKISFLREVMANYGVNKPMMITEASLLCPEWVSECNPVSNGFLEAQADYITWLYVRSWAENMMGAIWYTLEDSGWRSSGLYLASSPKPAYFAFQFAAKELEEARITAPISRYLGLTGYEFRSLGKRIWVLWSPNLIDIVINLPAGVSVVYDKYGATIAPVSGQITVNSPVYIELTP